MEALLQKLRARNDLLTIAEVSALLDFHALRVGFERGDATVALLSYFLQTQEVLPYRFL